MPSSVLAVPIHLDALVVPPNFGAAWSQIDYTQLRNRVSPLETLSDIGDVPGADVTRVVLHWALPDALTRGDYSGAPRFPNVPDRWLVARFDAGKGTGARFWVIESDYLDPTQGTSSFLDPAKETTPTSVATTRIGRAWTIDDWEATTPTPSSQSFLTAVGPATSPSPPSHPTAKTSSVSSTTA